MSDSARRRADPTFVFGELLTDVQVLLHVRGAQLQNEVDIRIVLEHF